MNTKQNPILEALETLHAKFPNMRVDIWIRHENNKIQYTATVETNYITTIFGEWNENLDSAVSALIAKAGTEFDVKRKAIAYHRQELQKLEEQCRAV